MLEIGINYKEYLTKLKKEELVKIITIYNKLCDIFECEKISDTKSKKDILINNIVNVKDNYLKYIIMSLDLKDYEDLKKILKKNDTKTLNEHKELINYLKDCFIIFQNDNLEVPNDLDFKNCFKNKEIQNYVKKWNRIYDLANGVIIAYGVVSKEYFSFITSGTEDKEIVIPKLDFYYKKDYKIEEKMLVSIKLSSKKRINKYFKDKNYNFVVATIHPDNIYSINNFIKDNFKQTSTKEFKRGLRNIYVKKLINK